MTTFRIQGGDGVFSINNVVYETGDYEVKGNITKVSIVAVIPGGNYLLNNVPIGNIIDVADSNTPYTDANDLHTDFAAWSVLPGGAIPHIEDLTTLENEVTKSLHPDGVGGNKWLDNPPDPEAGMMTGIRSGGQVTINVGDNATFDVAAGNGIVIDWTDPNNPKRTNVAWDGLVAQAVPDLGAGFTVIAIDLTGALVKQSGLLFTNAQRRSLIELQAMTHQSAVQVDSISASSTPAYEILAAILDYIFAAGPVNTGNQYTANGANLQVDKGIGSTTLPFINRLADPQNPTEKSNAAQLIVPFIRTHRDGVGGFVFGTGNILIDPDQYDDGSGVLAAVGNNRFSIQRIYFFGQTEQSTIVYGQDTYNTLEQAVSAVAEESPVVPPIFSSGKFETALVLRKGTTDLTNIADAKFVVIG